VSSLEWRAAGTGEYFGPGNVSPIATNVVLVLVRPPVRSNGRTYKMLVMFLFFSNA